MPSDLQKARELFLHAVGKLPSEQWESYLADACDGNSDLAQQVEILLQVHREAGSFLDAPAFGLDETALHPISERPGTIIGPYKLLQQIGEGGMGVVFMAEQTEPIQRTVALKIIKPGMDTRQVIARFEAERQALAMMDHPNIARVLDAGTTDSGRPYFVMELVKGVPITRYCDEKHLPLRARLELLLPVCQAVQHAHQKGVIHRDIKPSNVLVAEYDDQAVPKIIDFGVAKATAQKLTDRTMFTEFGQVVGTVEYMSPEQAKFNQLDIDTRSDIYSLGVLLYELLTGSTPFGRKRLQEAAFDEALRIIREEEPQKPSTRLSTTDGLPSIAANRHSEPARLSKDVRGELDWVVMKALEKDRNRRYETANGLARDVERYLHDEPVQACPPSAAYRFRKFARRNKVSLFAAAAAMATLVLLVIGLAVSNLLIAAERNQKAEALIEKDHALTAAKKSEEAAKAESQRAEAGFLRACIAIREIMTKAALGAGEWSQLPPPLRKRFAEEAIKFYEELLQESNPNPSLRYETAVGYRSIGGLHATSGEFPQAEAAFRRSVAILDPLVTEHPAVPEYRHQLAWSLLSLGRTLRNTKRFDEGKSPLHKGAELYETLLSQTPNSIDFLGELATCYLELSRCHSATRDFKPAVAAIKRGIVVLEAATPKQPDRPQYQEQLARLQLALGQLRAGDGQVKEAKAAFRAAAEHFEDAFSKQQNVGILYHWILCYGELMSLPNADPQLGIAEAEQAYREVLKIKSRIPADLTAHRDLRERIGHSQRGWAFKLWGAGRLDEAEQAFVEAGHIFDKLTIDGPNTALPWAFAADTHFQIGRLMIIRADHEHAEKALRRSIEFHEQRLAKFPNDSTAGYEGDRAASYNTLARLLATSPLPQQRNPAHAIELADKAVKIQPTEGGHWNTLGIAHYRAGEWQAAADALQKSMDLRGGGDAFDWFFLAMAHQQLGHKDKARTRYDQGIEWTDRNHPNDAELKGIRAEAAKLLTFTDETPSTKTKVEVK